MPTVIAAEGPVLDRVLDATCRSVRAGLNRQACGKFHRARLKTSWGARHQRSFALVDGDEVLAAAERYDLTGVLDGGAVRVCAVGSLWTGPAQPEGVYARTLVDALIADAEREGAEMALLFPSASGCHDGSGCHEIPMPDLVLSVTESSRHGAPMTMVRGGEERDLAAIVAMGRVRADHVRFHLDRDKDFIQYILTTRRLLAGLGPAHARQLHFFIAEEGITAAAYVVVSVAGDSWTLEECGDRDASGARVGALLQALIARDPGKRRPTIHACLPANFLPPQLAVTSTINPTPSIKVRPLASRAAALSLCAEDVLFWHNDLL